MRKWIFGSSILFTAIACGDDTEDALDLAFDGDAGSPPPSDAGAPDAAETRTVDAALPVFTIGGTVTGVKGTAGVTLSLNGTTDLVRTADGVFTFKGALEAGTTYAVTVKTQPTAPLQVCAVANGTGTVGTADVTNIAVTCTTTAFAIGGTITGATGPVVLQNNGGDDVTVTTGTTFAFEQKVPNLETYAVTVKSKPDNQTCIVAPPSGTVGTADVTDVAVTCTTLSSCNAIKTGTPAAASGEYVIDPDGAGVLGPITVYCDMTTDGGGYTYYAVTGGISTTRFDEANSCDAVGLHMAIPRTQAHLNALLARYGMEYFQVVPGIYGLVSGTDFTPATMNSGDAAIAAAWRSLDGGPWFVRSSPYGEPNGDYTAGCWLSATFGGAPDADGFRFNDANCNYATGPLYVCSDNAK